MLTRMQQRRGTQAEWNDSVIASTVILQAGELGLETDTGRFKIGNGVTVWQDLPYYLPDNNPSNVPARQGKNNQDIYSRLSPLAPTYTQNFTGAQVLVPQSGTQTPLVVSGLAGQSAVLQRWRDSNDITLASIDQTGKLTTANGALFNATVDMNNHIITNLPAPTGDNDATNKLYVDNAIAGLAWKEAVHLIAHGPGTNVALTGATGTLIIDGHDPLVQADSGIYRILLTGQTNATQNGIYLYTDNGTTYTLTRTTDADSPAELKGSSVYVQEGTTYGTSSWVQSNYTIDSFDDQVWVQFSGAALITAGDGMTKDGNRLDVGGTTDRITANADSIDIAATYVGQTSITTLGTVTTGTWDANTIDETRGGTGQTSYAVGDILYADTTTSLNKLTAGTAGYPILSGGSSTAPAYGQVNTTGIADDAVTYAKMQNVANQYRVLGRISAGSGNTEEVNPDQLMTIINQGNTDISFSLLPVGTTSTTVAQGDHTHTLDQLDGVTITNDPVLGTPKDRQVIKYKGAPINAWVNELPSGGISIGSSPPVDAAPGDAWFDSTDGSLYVYYDDASGSPSAQWVQVKANSALEASILTRVSALEARSTDIEAANAVRVANQAERDSVYPAPVQGNTVFRADLGYEEKYYAAYNVTTNPDGTTGTPGWYEYRGAAPLSPNLVINGNFDIWQRGTSISVTPSALAYTADRWYCVADGTTSVTRIATGQLQGSTYSLRSTRSTATPGSHNLNQLIETLHVRSLMGKTVTFSIYLRRSAGIANPVSINIYKSSTVDAGNAASWSTVATTNVPISVIPTGTTSFDWYRASVTALIPNDGTANTLMLSVGTFGINNNDYFEISQAQIEVGPVFTSFHRNQENIQAELAACQRYYFRSTPGTVFGEYTICYVGAATSAYAAYRLPVTMRVEPTTLDLPSPITALKLTNTSTTNWTISAITAGSGSPDVARLSITSSGMTVGQAISLANNNNAAGFIGFNAEL